MLNKMFVYEALKRSLNFNSDKKMPSGDPSTGQDTLISLLMHDIFGAEILKTHTKKDWHFYNRIDGEVVDFTIKKAKKSVDDARFENIPSTPAETSDYVDQNDYSTFLMSFVRAFEETIGLDKYKLGYSN
jgi:hypothetical protein